MARKSPSRRRPPLVLITGASQGLGAAIALAYARAFPGAKLALVARQPARLEAVAARCDALGADTHGFVCDVTDASAVARLPVAVSKIFRRTPDILVNNAGRFTPAPFAATTPALLDEMLAANLRSAFLVTQAFLPAFTARRAGDLVFISSIAAKTALAGCAAYTIAKHGLTGLSAALRAETKASGLRVLCLHPGATDTPAWDGSGVDRSRLMSAAGVAQAVVALTSLPPDLVAEDLTLRPAAGDL